MDHHHPRASKLHSTPTAIVCRSLWQLYQKQLTARRDLLRTLPTSSAHPMKPSYFCVLERRCVLWYVAHYRASPSCIRLTKCFITSCLMATQRSSYQKEIQKGQLAGGIQLYRPLIMLLGIQTVHTGR